MAATNIAQEITRLTTAKADIKTAIEGKGVTVPSSTLIDGYATLINAIPTPIEEAPENDVNFYDYDGFRVASYTIAEAKALTALPTPPSHNGLTFQEWNWSLSDIQSYNRQYIDIGANYVTSDGKTHIKIKVASDSLSVVVNFRHKNGTLTIEWGDNSTSDTYTYGTTETAHQFTHTFAQAGEYVLLVSSSSTTEFILPLCGTITTWSAHIVEMNVGNKIALTYDGCFTLQPPFTLSISTDTNCEFYRAFRYSSCKQVNIPRNTSLTITQTGGLSGFNGKVCFPALVNSISATGFLSGYLNEKLVIPQLTSATVANDFFNTMYFCRVISIPNSFTWTSQGNNYFGNCYSLSALDIVQGWTPTFNIVFNASTRWTADTLVDFFTKLGTTQTAITLTFGATNLAKLSEEQKAIATSKGYTLA